MSIEDELGPARARLPGRWYLVVTIATAGSFAWVPFLHAARKLDSYRVRRLALIYGCLAVFLFVLPQNSQGQPDSAGNALSVAGALLAPVVIIAGCLQLSALRRRLPENEPVDVVEDPSTVLAARVRRGAARRLVAEDPLLARELRVGRPDLGRDYDDGGLIDLNSAPARLIAEMCDIPAEAATSIVEARNGDRGPFANVEEVFVQAELPAVTWSPIRERAVLLR